MKPKTIILRAVLRVIAILGERSLAIIARLANMSLGKGFGATTLKLEVKTIQEFCEDRDISISNIVDIGGNIGAYSQELRSHFPDAKIVAFEPSTEAAEKFSHRFADDPKVTLIQSAVGKMKGTATLYSDFESSGLASLTNRRLDHFGINFANTQEVQVITLDEWFNRSEIIPDFIKIDVEGHELDVLSGGEQVISTTKLIQFEFGGCNIDTRTFFQDFYYFFKDAGFQLFRITPKGLDSIEKYSEEDEYFATTNYLAVNTRLVKKF